METLELKPNQIRIVDGFNARIYFDPEALAELAQTIKEHGILSPLLVRPSKKKGTYDLIAGERRFRAGQTIELDKYPVIVRNIDDKAAIELMAIENLQRNDLHPIEEALAIDKLMLAGLSNQQIADKIGMSQSFVSKRNALNNLSLQWRDVFMRGSINLGAAQALARVYKPDQDKIYKDLESSLAPGKTLHSNAITNAIERLSVTLDQNSVPFRLDDPTILPKAGACTTCSKRSCAILEIFNQPDREKDVCLDSECYSAKVDVVVKKAEAEAIKKLEEERAKKAAAEAKRLAAEAKAPKKKKSVQKGSNAVEEEQLTEVLDNAPKQVDKKEEPAIELLKVSTDYVCKIPGVVGYENYNEVRKDTPGAIPALVVAGHRKVGELIYVLRSHQGGPMTDEQKEARKQLIRSNKIENTTTRLCVSAIADRFYGKFMEDGAFDATVMDYMLSDKIGFGQSQDFMGYLTERYGLSWVDMSDYMGRREAITNEISKLDGALKLKLLVDCFFLWTTINDNNGPVLTVASAMDGVDVDTLRQEATKIVDAKKGRKSKADKQAEEAFQAAAQDDFDREVDRLEQTEDIQEAKGSDELQHLDYAPFLKQYDTLKKSHDEALVLIAADSYYLTFRTDAGKLAGLNTGTLSHAVNLKGQEVEVCSFPLGQLETIKGKIVAAGLKLAIAQLLEAPTGKKKVKELVIS